MDTSAKTFPGFRGTEKPQAMICTIEFNRIVWNTFALLKPLLETGKKECLLTLKWVQTPRGQTYTVIEIHQAKCCFQTFIVELMYMGLYLCAWNSKCE